MFVGVARRNTDARYTDRRDEKERKKKRGWFAAVSVELFARKAKAVALNQERVFSMAGRGCTPPFQPAKCVPRTRTHGI